MMFTQKRFLGIIRLCLFFAGVTLATAVAPRTAGAQDTVEPSQNPIFSTAGYVAAQEEIRELAL
jgi:hypothetical protein